MKDGTALITVNSMHMDNIKGIEEQTSEYKKHCFEFRCDTKILIPHLAKAINNLFPGLKVDVDKGKQFGSTWDTLTMPKRITRSSSNSIQNARLSTSLISKRKPQGPIEIDLEAEEDDDDCNIQVLIENDYAAIKRSANPEMSFVFPFSGGIGAITLTGEDQDRLNAGVFLNDNLIEFYLR